MNQSKKFVLLIALALISLAAFFAFPVKKANHQPEKTNVANDQANDSLKGKITETEQPESVSEKNNEETAEKSKPEIPAKFLLEIPFYSQTPLSKWDAFHEEMCEEASVLNATLYLLGKKLSKEDFEKELQKIKKAEEKEIGEWKSTTIVQMKKFANVYFEGKIKSKIIEGPTIEDIETEVAAGNPVIAPLSGRDIGNPNFTPPGPVYHMVVIKGYDNQNFITNDVGTRKGNSYTYKKEVIMKNIHDWNETDIHKGTQRILVIYK